MKKEQFVKKRASEAQRLQRCMVFKLLNVSVVVVQEVALVVELQFDVV